MCDYLCDLVALYKNYHRSEYDIELQVMGIVNIQTQKSTSHAAVSTNAEVVHDIFQPQLLSHSTK